jgi:hypothetical protein
VRRLPGTAFVVTAAAAALAAAALATAALAAAAPATAALATDALDIRVSPRVGNPSTVFKVAFTVPRPAGHDGVYERSYSVELAVGEARRNCKRSARAEVGQAEEGERVRLSFRGRRPWCRGDGRGAVYEMTGPYCPPGSERPCPAFPSQRKKIGGFGFRVR